MSSAPPEAAAEPETATDLMGAVWEGKVKRWVRVRV